MTRPLVLALLACMLVCVCLGAEQLPATEGATQRQLLQLEGAESQVLEQIIKVKRALPRYDLQGKEVSKTFNPMSLEYLTGVFLLGVPSLVFAAVSLLVLIVYMLWTVLRACLHKCTGRDVCWNAEKAARSCMASKGVQNTLKVVFVIGVAACVAGGAMGYVGNARVQTSFSLSFSTLDKAAARLVDTATGIRTDLNAAREAGVAQTTEKEINSATNPLIQASSAARKQLTSLQGTVEEYDVIRLWVINISLGFAVLASLVGVYGIVRGRGWIFALMAMLGLVAMTIIWLQFAAHLPISVMIGDFCYSVQQFASTGTPQPGVSVLLACANNASSGESRTMINNADTKCFQGLQDLGAKNGVRVTRQNYRTIDTRTWTTDDRKAYAKLASAMDAIVSAGKRLNELLSCSIVREAVTGMQYSVCLKMLTGLDLIIAACAVIGIALLVDVIIAMLGRRRFDTSYAPLTGDMDDFDPVDLAYEDTATGAAARRKSVRQSIGFRELKVA